MPSRSWIGHSSTSAVLAAGVPERWRLYEVSWNDASAGVSPRGEQGRLTPSLEREAERASLRRLLDDALRPRQAGVGRRRGIGKSRLVTEIGDVAQARGMRELTGHCVEMSGDRRTCRTSR